MQSVTVNPIFKGRMMVYSFVSKILAYLGKSIKNVFLPFIDQKCLNFPLVCKKMGISILLLVFSLAEFYIQGLQLPYSSNVFQLFLNELLRLQFPRITSKANSPLMRADSSYYSSWGLQRYLTQRLDSQRAVYSSFPDSLNPLFKNNVRINFPFSHVF